MEAEIIKWHPQSQSKDLLMSNVYLLVKYSNFYDVFLYFSDIDLAVIGEWESMPLRTIEKCLIDNGIANPSTIKVLEKASVSVPFIYLLSPSTLMLPVTLLEKTWNCTFDASVYEKKSLTENT